VMILRLIVDFILGMLGGLTLLILIEGVKVMGVWLRTEDEL
jgi:hypothetical protein